MKKIFTALALGIIFMLEASGAFAYEFKPYVGDGLIKATSAEVKLYNESGDEVSQISEASKVSAECYVKPGSDFDSALEVSLIAAAYKENILLKYAISDKTEILSAADSARKLTKELDIKDINADEIKVYLWDNEENARPLFKMGSLKSGSGSADTIIIGGNIVNTDSANKGSVEVNAGYTKWPEVIVLADNLTSDVRVNLRGAFPLSAPSHSLMPAEAEAYGESKEAYAEVIVNNKTYNITVTQAVPQITDVDFIEYGEKVAVSVQYDVTNPIWTDELPGPNKEAIGSDIDTVSRYCTGVKELENLSLPYTDKTQNNNITFFLFNISPELLNSQMFSVPFSTKSDAKAEGDGYTFSIDRSARIYVQNTNLGSDPSWTRAQNTMAGSESLKNQMYYELRAGDTSNSVQTVTGNAVYYKDYEVTPGEKVSISLPAVKGMPKIFVKYKDRPTVANACYSTAAGDVSVETTGLYKPLYIDENKESEKYKIASTVVKEGTVSGNLLFGSTLFSEENRRQLCITDLPQELEGAAALKLPFTFTDAKQISFDIDASSRVYVFTNAGNQTGSVSAEKFKTALGDGWKNTEFVYEDSALNENDIALTFRSNNTSANSYIRNGSSFYRDYITEPDDSRHISIDLPDLTSSTRVMVVVKSLEE